MLTKEDAYNLWKIEFQSKNMKLVSGCKQYIEKSFRKIYTATRTKEDIKDESEGRKPER